MVFRQTNNGLARGVLRTSASVYSKIWPAGSLTSNFAEWFALPLAILLAKNVFGASKTPVFLRAVRCLHQSESCRGDVVVHQHCDNSRCANHQKCQ